MTQVVELSSLLVSRPDYRQGRPCLRGTGITVHTVAAAYMAGLSAEDIARQNPGLDSSAIHAAIAYFLANRVKIEAELDADRVAGEELAALFPEGLTRDNLDRVQPFLR